MDRIDRTAEVAVPHADPHMNDLREAIGLLVPDPTDSRMVRVRWRSDTGELLVQLRVSESPARLVHRWRRWAPHESGRSIAKAMRLATEAIRAERGAWAGWSTGAPPYLPFLCDLRRPS